MINEPVKLGDILWKSLDTIEFKKDIYPKLVESQWFHILGPTLIQHCKFQKIDEGTLYIKVNSIEWYRELTELKLKLIDKFNRYFNKIIITEIEFIAPAYAKPRTRTRAKKNR